MVPEGENANACCVSLFRFIDGLNTDWSAKLPVIVNKGGNVFDPEVGRHRNCRLGVDLV